MERRPLTSRIGRMLLDGVIGAFGVLVWELGASVVETIYPDSVLTTVLAPAGWILSGPPKALFTHLSQYGLVSKHNAMLFMVLLTSYGFLLGVLASIALRTSRNICAKRALTRRVADRQEKEESEGER